MRAISLYLLPPILNTVRRPTRSADGNCAFTSGKFLQLAFFVSMYHACKTFVASWCFSENSRIALRLITLTRYVRIMRTLCPAQDSRDANRSYCGVFWRLLRNRPATV